MATRPKQITAKPRYQEEELPEGFVMSPVHDEGAAKAPYRPKDDLKQIADNSAIPEYKIPSACS